MTTYKKQKVTVALDSLVYQGLVQKVGKRKIGAFLSHIARPHVVEADLDRAYEAMAADEKREQEAREWLDAPIDASVT